jgi:hypothetical protein
VKIQLHPSTRQNTQGSVLLISLAIMLILGMGLASYLTVVQTEKISAVRSQCWNAALTAAEAGVEEAMAQLNPSAILYTNGSAYINRGANGWTFSDGMYRSGTRTIVNGKYGVSITADAFPIIYSTGYVTVPMQSEPVVRTVRVRTTTAPTFFSAVASRSDVNFKGFGVNTDSFDSMDPDYSTGGLYDPAKRKATGDVASTDGVIDIQNSKVMGTLYTGPSGTNLVGANGSVGDVGWVLGGNKGLQEGHHKNDFNMEFPEVLAPYDIGLQPPAKTVLGTNYVGVMGNADYVYENAITLKTGDSLLVTGARARLYVKGNFQMQGSSKLVIAPGASLELFVAGADASITSVNNGGNCSTFKYFGMASNTTLSFGGNDAFLGTIYAPSAAFTLGGGGNNTVDFQGACSVFSIKMNGHFNFHFDENLRKKGPISGFVVSSWNEI